MVGEGCKVEVEVFNEDEDDEDVIVSFRRGTGDDLSSCEGSCIATAVAAGCGGGGGGGGGGGDDFCGFS